ncbi:HPP family protein [Martelella mediterranea]|uniref:CBS domain-containing membrane protein n=1 Tax=Martelella mediterranea TaxID=293089 RepID=A0A4R3NPR3_9HYPH|nr:HPP family protein [Martelella mediterranea]TCT34692.1 CBS domain-containing membrane protein [Martelella mediterranea]
MHFHRSFGPAVSHASSKEAFRAGIGAFVGLGLVGLFLLSPAIDLQLGLYLVAPFGATSVLLFAVPNSPLAQPWSAIVGNTIAALIGVAVGMAVSDLTLSVALAVGLSIIATVLCRAVHPPAGAVAMTAVMSPEAIDQLGFWFALAPVAIGTVALVLVAAAYARLTGRRYPFRQFDDPSKHHTEDRNPSERLGLSEGELTEILERYRQSFNLGVEDLARLIGAAELQAATHTTTPLKAEDIMSRDLITVGPDTGLKEVADLFRYHSFTSLPVIGTNDEFLGVIFQIHLINQAREPGFQENSDFTLAFRRLLARDREKTVNARRIMSTTGPRAAKDTPVAALLPMMAEGEVDAVPILEGDRIIGIVTRTDLIAAMARNAVRSQ